MATYYKWAERQADTTINWAEVGKNLSDTLKQEAQLREAKKAALDAETRALGEKLENMPMGDFEPSNQFMLEFGGSAQETRLIQDNLLRAGMIKPKDFAIMRQNLNDGTTTMIDLGKQYEAEYQEKLARIDNTDPTQRSQAIESVLMESIEGLSNLRNTKAVINPTDGQVTLGKLVEKTVNGETVRTLSDDPADVFTVNELNMRIKQKFDYFDVDNYLNKEVEQLGEVKSMMLKAASKSGDLNMIYSIIDAKEGTYLSQSEIDQYDRKYKETGDELYLRFKESAIAAMSYKTAEKDMIDGLMSSPLYVSSLLTENMNGGVGRFQYEATLDSKRVKYLEDEMDRMIKDSIENNTSWTAEDGDRYEELENERNSLVLFEKTSTGALVPVFTEEQESDVFDYLKLSFRKRISQSREAQAAGIKAYSPERLAAASFRYSAAGQEEEEQLEAVGLWNKVAYADTPEARQSALDAVAETPIAKANGITNIKYDGVKQEMVFTIFKDGRIIEDRKKYDPTKVTLLDHAELGNVVHGISNLEDLNREIAKANKNPNTIYERNLSGFETTPTKSVTQENVKLYIDSFEDEGRKTKDIMEEGGYQVVEDKEGDYVLVDQDNKVLLYGGTSKPSNKEIRRAIKAHINNPSNATTRNRLINRSGGAKDISGINTAEYE